MANPIQQLLRNHKDGEPVGIYSVCSANRFVLEAAMIQARKDGSLLLVEATSNQVDQYGGYTGMTPSAFVTYIREIADTQNFPFERIVLGGDHLGPNVWQGEPAESAMAKAREQMAAYVDAGFSKIHLDTSMRCADDPGDMHDPLDPAIIADRAADLCAVAEKTFAAQKSRRSSPVYVIGTEVPIPGGAQEELNSLKPSSIADTRRTIELTRQAFQSYHVNDAWDRVIAVVVQPGVEFGDDTVVDYNRQKAARLSALMNEYPNLVYEAHSTDYQIPQALKQLVEDHFAILKVGPWLTYALREAVFALAEIESEWLGRGKSIPLSDIKSVLETAMIAQPQYWQKHYHGSDQEIAFARKYSYSDRIRYYWPNPSVTQAFQRLLQNLTTNPAPMNLLSQYLPQQHEAIRQGQLVYTPDNLIHHRILAVIKIYAEATGLAKNSAISAV